LDRGIEEMTLAAGTKLGSYEVASQIGAGGMGEVYRAHDTKLGRDVAIKVLPEAFAHDPERLSRFQREAKMLAALNHPNIATIYGLEQSGGTNYLVMEMVAGENLAERVKREGAVPIDEALAIAKQIAEALEAAHEKGIVHRDLKPANVKVTPEGNVKVLDFGLAKAFEGDAANEDVSNSPTLSMAATMHGVILGTAAYMSPEQARGKAVDKRTDIWAFGAVLYELLTGKQAFHGEDTTDILAAVVRADPDWSQLPASTPASIRLLLRRCLRKDRRQRLADAADVRIEIEDALSSGPSVEPIAAAGRLVFLVWAAFSGTLLLSLAALAFIHFRETPPPLRVARFQIPLPDKTTLPIFELSPDGRMLAFSAVQDGHRRLWVRPIDSLVAQPVPGAEDATYVFWSPDSDYIGFFVPGKLKKIALTGGPPQTICDAPDGRGGSWNRDGVIVFSPGPGSAIERVSAGGGVPAAVTNHATPDELHRFPVFLPDNKHFLYLSNQGKPETNGIRVGSLDAAPSVSILPDESSAAYAPSGASGVDGYLLFRREGTLMGVPFDPGRLRVTGEVFPVAEGVGISRNTNAAAFSVSRSGALAYGNGGLFGGSEIRELSWMDRAGKRLGGVGQPGRIATVALSPDEKRILFNLVNVAGDAADVWLLDAARGVPSRFTFGPGLAADAIWSPDGSTSVFEADNRVIYRKPADGTGKEELLSPGGINIRTLDWSRDGKFVVYQSYGGATGTDLWLLPIQGDHKPVSYLQTPFNEGLAQFSPDGRWMAYASNESGQAQVYVQSIPASGAKWQISPSGGDQPRWRRDGKELFYISADRKLMAVSVKDGDAAFEAGAPQPLFELDPMYPPLWGRFAYQPAANGQKFLILTNVGGTAAPPITVVLNWQAGLKK
jgi:eukaryotic-like serine/threonine-protein kinase